MKMVQMIIALLLFASCNKRQCGETELNSLLGRWEWVQSSGGISGTVSTPASTGKIIFLDIFDDETFTLTENNIVTRQGKLNLKNQHCIHSNLTKPSISLGEGQQLTIETMTTTMLSLGQEQTDGMLFEYSR